MPAFIDFPAWLKPEIIPGLPFRWYGLMYVLAFGTTWLLFRHESHRIGASWSDDEGAGFFFAAIAGIILGGRLAGTLIYEPTDYYWRKPWFIFWPFDETGAFVGFQGMSFHGGFVGVIVATLIWCRVKKKGWWKMADIVAMATPLGYTLGRLGNFINGELWGKVTTAPWGIVFPYAEKFPAKEQWVQDAAAKVGIPLGSMNDMVNLPRHPSQLYEALFEGLLLWAVLWLVVRKRKPYDGFAVGAYTIGYGFVRFFVEYFREPDSGLGYILPWGDPEGPTYLFTTPFNFSMGQILCAMMIAAGIVILVVRRKASIREEDEARAVRLSGRKLRKKIR